MHDLCLHFSPHVLRLPIATVVLAELSNTKCIKIAERDKINTHNTQIHERSFSWLGTSTSIKKSDGVKLVLGPNLVFK
jgi:hypothetical protein